MIDPTKRAETAAGPPTLQMPQQAPPVNRTGNAPTSALNPGVQPSLFTELGKILDGVLHAPKL